MGVWDNKGPLISVDPQIVGFPSKKEPKKEPLMSDATVWDLSMLSP